MRALRKLKCILAALVTLAFIGTAGFHYLEGWSWFDGFYFVVITFTSIGYGEVHELSRHGRMFNIGLIISGAVLVALAIGTLTQGLLEFEITKLLGRLHFRHSYSQNILDHSVEVAHLMGLMAAELGLEVAPAKRAGLLHDLGKALNHEIEGPHALVGADLIKRYGESDAVVNGVASHHNDVPPIGPLGILVSAADAISASRPGARSENMTTYLKRVEDLEKIAGGFPGVEKTFAVQAGREIRVFVQPNQIGDEQAFVLARNIASKIENDLQYPGQIKVTVIRETRCVEVAK